jgi:hypothetical protein
LKSYCGEFIREKAENFSLRQRIWQKHGGEFSTANPGGKTRILEKPEKFAGREQSNFI